MRKPKNTILLVLAVAVCAVVIGWAVRSGRTNSGAVRLKSRHGNEQVPQAVGPITAVKSDPHRDANRPIAVLGDGYVGSQACRGCHEGSYKTWHASYHRTMTQVADAQSAAKTFKNVDIDTGDARYRLQSRGSELWIEPEDEGEKEGPIGDGRRVMLTTGSHHFQVLWLSSGKGRELQMWPYLYRIEDDRWMPDHAVFIRPPIASGTVERESGVWNRTCMRCHTTHPNPRYSEEGIFDTRAAEFGISCEACHGPGQEHVESASRNSDKLAIVHPEKLTPTRATQVCGQCHGSTAFRTQEDDNEWLRHGFAFRPADDLEEHRAIVTEGEYQFWEDGMVRVAGREYNGMINTPCFTHDDMAKQITCMSCHVMHQMDDDPRTSKEWANDLLKLEMDSNHPGLHNNKACTQCHQNYVDSQELAAHTHHSATSSASVCYNCHMPHSSWGVMRAIRSHTISSPNVEESLNPVGRPNACNLCHLDKTLAWTAEQMQEKYGHSIPELTDDERNIASGVRWALNGDAGQRALTAWALGWEPAQQASGHDWMVPMLLQLMADPYDAVRSAADRSLQTIDGYSDLQYDFLASADARQEVIERAFKTWNQQERKRSERSAAEVLLTPSGTLQGRKVRRLIKDRDNHPFILLE